MTFAFQGPLPLYLPCLVWLHLIKQRLCQYAGEWKVDGDWLRCPLADLQQNLQLCFYAENCGPQQLVHAAWRIVSRSGRTGTFKTTHDFEGLFRNRVWLHGVASSLHFGYWLLEPSVIIMGSMLAKRAVQEAATSSSEAWSPCGPAGVAEVGRATSSSADSSAIQCDDFILSQGDWHPCLDVCSSDEDMQDQQVAARPACESLTQGLPDVMAAERSVGYGLCTWCHGKLVPHSLDGHPLLRCKGCEMVEEVPADVLWRFPRKHKAKAPQRMLAAERRRRVADAASRSTFGKCDMCHRRLVPRCRQSDGSPYLRCTAWTMQPTPNGCRYSTS